MATQNYNILSFDGGGIRGLMSALLLQNLPASAVANTEVFAGTSTGGIIACALSAGLDAQKLVDLYSAQCSTIFSGKLSPAASHDQIKAYLEKYFGWAIAETLLGLLDLKVLPVSFFAAKYNPSGLRSALSNALGAHVNTMVSQVPKKLFVTTFQLDNGKSWMPVSIDNFPPVSNDSTLLDAALSTSAAETYFPPHKHPTLGYCVDGGTFANNPSTYVLARVLQSGVDPRNIRMLSIGTGETANAIPNDYIDNPDNKVPPEVWGMLQWSFPLKAPKIVGSLPILDALTSSSSEVNDEQTATILGANYMRAQVPLSQPITLDSCAEVPVMQQLAKDYMATDDWKKIVAWVGENFV